jgi:Rad3-related DNA helicase
MTTDLSTDLTLLEATPDTSLLQSVYGASTLPAVQAPLDDPQSFYGLPHPPSRPGQAETMDWLLALPHKTTAIVGAPTGSGKTSFAAAMGAREKAVALVKTKSLQSENYGESYAFDVLFGKSNYECVNDYALKGTTAAECLYEGDEQECAVYAHCPYITMRDRVRESARGSLNYAYWLASRWPRKTLHEYAENNGKPYLFLDEAHQLSEITLEHASCTIGMHERLTYDLPSFPIAYTSSASTQAAVRDWLAASAERMDDVVRELPEATPEMRKAKQLQSKLETVLSALQHNSTDWFVRSGPGARGNNEPGLVARPLTARYHFPSYFLGHWTTVAMSATIGDPQTFAEELGLSEYIYRAIPNQWPAATRPIYDLGAPAMGMKATEADYREQARVIGKAISECPREWSGLILVNSKAQAKRLMGMLMDLYIPGLSARLWMPSDGMGTEAMLAAWKQFKRSRRGALAITWAWWEGYDGREEKICIVAKVPYPNIGDEYESARMQYSGTFFRQRTAWNLEQGVGRTRRGVDADYDTPHGERRGFVAIADANWTGVQKYLSPDVREAIVKL